MYNRNMVSRKVGLLLVSLLGLAGLTPIRMKSWLFVNSNDHFYTIQPMPYPIPAKPIPPIVQADFDQDGKSEQLILESNQAKLISTRGIVWESPDNWQVSQARLTDLNHDGQIELTMLVWRPFKPWPIDAYLPRGGRIQNFQNSAGYSCHLILIGFKNGKYRELWAGSALAEPLQSFSAADVDSDGNQELVALESDYSDPDNAPACSLTFWEWNGFGFTLLRRIPGSFSDFQIEIIPGGSAQIVTQE
jgi:hypothetical protein